MKKISESIFDGNQFVIPMAEVSHFEKYKDTSGLINRILVIMKHSKWNEENQQMEPNIYLDGDQSLSFQKSWCFYRSEIEEIKASE